MNKLNKSTFILSLMLVATLIVGYCVRTYFISFRLVEGNSMMPTFKNGDLIMVDMWNKNFKPGNIVIFKMNDQFLIKRIIADSHSKLYVENFNLFINEKLVLEKPYNPHWDKSAFECRFSEVLESSRDQVLVLGDNRCYSFDSRVFGSIPKKDIIGKMVFSTDLFNFKKSHFNSMPE